MVASGSRASRFRSLRRDQYAQIEPRDHGDGFLALTLRHQKQNFAPLVEPFGVRVVFEADKVTVSKEELAETDLAGEETISARERVYKAIKSFEDAEGTKSDVVEATGLAEGTVKKEIAALKREAPPRVWDTERVEGRQAIVTTLKPKPSPSGSGSNIYKGTGTGTAKEPQREPPLSADLKDGESATLEELKERRTQDTLVEATGETDRRTEQVRLTVPASRPYKRDGDGRKQPLSADLKDGESAYLQDLEEDRSRPVQEHPLDCECVACSSPAPRTAHVYEERFQ